MKKVLDIKKSLVIRFSQSQKEQKMSDQCINCTARGDYAKCVNTPCSHHESWIDKKRISLINNFGRKYHELIMAVQHKYPNESRHETALRYIKEFESHAANHAGNHCVETVEGSNQ